jgi:hypothetical protein
VRSKLTRTELGAAFRTGTNHLWAAATKDSPAKTLSPLVFGQEEVIGNGTQIPGFAVLHRKYSLSWGDAAGWGTPNPL